MLLGLKTGAAEGSIVAERVMCNVIFFFLSLKTDGS